MTAGKGPMPVQRWCIAAIAAALLVVQASRANAADSSATEPAFAPDAIPLGQYLGNSGTLASNGSTEPEYFLAIYSGSTYGSYFSVASTICEIGRASWRERLCQDV